MLLGHGLWVASLPLHLAVRLVVGARTPLLTGPALRWTVLWRQIPPNAVWHVLRSTAAALVSMPSLPSRVFSGSRGSSMAGIATVEVDSSARRTSSPRSSELLPSRPVHVCRPLV